MLRMMAGVVALVGGDEFNPGNEAPARLLAGAAGTGPAFVVPTAAARQDPQASVQHAIAWFKQFGLELRELPVLKRTDANSKELAGLARTGGFFYLVGGDPGLVAQVLRSSRVWHAIFEAWLEGASLAGASAGAMARSSHSLIRATWPNRFTLRPTDALGLVPNTPAPPPSDPFSPKRVGAAQKELPGCTPPGIDTHT